METRPPPARTKIGALACYGTGTSQKFDVYITINFVNKVNTNGQIPRFSILFPMAMSNNLLQLDQS